MKRWIAYLLVSLLMQLVALVITPILPAFASPRLGKSDNGNKDMVGPRLPKWLAWFDTPDNDLDGDPNWRKAHPAGGYMDHVLWLYRNSLYGFKWTVLSAPMDRFKVLFDGDRSINYHTRKFGVLRASMGDYWQYKCIRPLIGGWCLMLNFGWLLDDLDQPRALFMFSPRLVRSDKELANA
jgi:hypothetical protein